MSGTEPGLEADPEPNTTGGDTRIVAKKILTAKEARTIAGLIFLAPLAASVIGYFVLTDKGGKWESSNVYCLMQAAVLAVIWIALGFVRSWKIFALGIIIALGVYALIFGIGVNDILR